MEMIEIGSRKIVIQGIGKLFYQSGFPISMAISSLKEKGFEVSILHIIDECLKNGWSQSTIEKKFHEDFSDSGGGEALDKSMVSKFCSSSYEDQREMIFQYLFGKASNNTLCKEDQNIIDVSESQFLNKPI